MAAPTVAVTVKLSAMGGPAYAGVAVKAKLDQNDMYQGFVISDEVSGTTDATGTVVLQLFPNNPTTGLGTTGSSYTFKASPPGGKSWKVTAQIPNTACNLESVADLETVPGLSAAEVAQDNAQASALAAAGSATAAASSATAASTSAGAAATSATAAAGSATAASGSATAAAGSATAAAGSATAAADSATAAAGSAASAAATLAGALRHDIAQSLTAPQQAQAQTNIGFEAAVLATDLAGLSTATSTDVTAADTTLSAFGKLQAKWNAIAATVRATVLTGLSTADATDVAAGDSLLTAAGKFQAKWNAIATTVRGTVLTGLSVASTAVVSATDTVLAAIGQLQAQITNLATSAGAALIGYTVGTANAILRTLQDVAREGVSVLDYMTDAQRADVRSGALTLDVTTAIQNAIDANPGKKIKFPFKTAKVTGTIYVRADNTIVWGPGASLVQYTPNIDTLVYEPTTAGVTAAFLNSPSHYYLGVSHSAAVYASHTSGAGVRFRQCNGYRFHAATINDAFEGLTIEGGQFGSLKAFKLFAANGAYAGAESALLHFRQAHVGGGVYQPCYTVNMDDYFMSASLLRDGCIRIANGDGLQISSNGYVGNGKNANIIVKADRDNSSVAVVTIEGYYDCVGTGKTVNGVEIRADGFANTDVYMLKFGSQCTIGNGDGSGIICRKPETSELTIGATIINMVGWAIDVEGANGQTDVNILPSARISNVGTGGVTGAIRISTVKVLSMVGVLIGAITTVALKLVGSNGRVTLTGNTNNANIADLDRTGATFTSFVTSGNASSYTGAVANSWVGFNALTAKATPVDADELPLADSAATFTLKKVTWANIKATLKTYLDTLYAPQTATGGQIAFPSTQVPSADVNTLDDYEEGTWTPVLTFATPGDLAVVYSTQVGTYTKIGRVVTLNFNIQTSTFTHTTASGNVNITGNAFVSGAIIFPGCISWGGITKAGFTQIDTSLATGGNAMSLRACGSGVASATVVAADMPTGGSVVLRGQLTFHV